MPPQSELHVNAVIDTSPEEEGQRQEVEQIPGPSRQFHQREQAEQAEAQRGQAQQNFRESPEGEPKRAQ